MRQVSNETIWFRYGEKLDADKRFSAKITNFPQAIFYRNSSRREDTAFDMNSFKKNAFSTMYRMRLLAYFSFILFTFLTDLLNLHM